MSNIKSVWQFIHNIFATSKRKEERKESRGFPTFFALMQLTALVHFQ